MLSKYSTMSMYSFDNQNKKELGKYNKIWLSLGNSMIIGNLYSYTFLNFLNLFLIIHKASVILLKQYHIHRSNRIYFSSNSKFLNSFIRRRELSNTEVDKQTMRLLIHCSNWQQVHFSFLINYKHVTSNHPSLHYCYIQI